MKNPEILGRTEDDDYTDARASTSILSQEEVFFEAGAVGTVYVKVFKSNDIYDRGGLVLRITLDDEGSSFIPHAEVLPNGIELHMAGDVEAQSLVKALKAALLSM